MRLLRVLHSTYEMLTEEKVTHLVKQSWLVVQAVLWSLFRDSSGSFATTFIGEACKPVAPGGTATVELQPGLGLAEESRGKWDGDVRPLFLEQAQPVEFTENNHNSGDDRIDAVFIRPEEVDQNEQTVWLRDPSQNKSYKDKRAQETEYGWETQVEEGSPAPSPSPPGPPPGQGWIRVADVVRPNGQNNVTAGDVTDQRTTTALQLNNATLRDTLKLITTSSEIRWTSQSQGWDLALQGGTGQDDHLLIWDYVAGTAGNLVVSLLAADTIQAYTGDVVQLVDAGQNLVDAILQVSRLKSPWSSGVDQDHVYVQAESSNADGDGEIHARNTPVAWATFIFDSSGNAEYTMSNGVGISSASKVGPGHFEATLDETLSFPGAAYPIVTGIVHDRNASRDWLTSNAQIEDDGFGNSQLDVQIKEWGVDFANSTVTHSVEDPVSNTEIFVGVYYPR